MQVGDLLFTAEAKDGVLKVTKFAAGGKDLELQGEGRIQMRELAPDSLADLNVRFKINDAYRTKDNNTKSLFGEPGSKLPALFEMSPDIKRAKRADGFYGFAMRGRISDLKFTPAGGGSAGAVPSTSGFGLPGGGSLPGAGGAQ
jgi:hypothetical protein